VYLGRIYEDLFAKKKVIPAHLLSQNLVQETQLLIELLHKSLDSHKDCRKLVVEMFWKVFFMSI